MAPPPLKPTRRRLPAGERRAEILREAARCFSSRGFNGTTTRDIAARLAITEAALYRHFSGKEAIYTAILDERSATPNPVQKVEAAAQADDDEGVFRGLAQHLLATVEADPTFLRLLLYSALEGHELSRPFHEKRIRPLREFLASYIERRIAQGAFRPIEPSLAAHAFVGMVVDHLIVTEVFGQRRAYPQPAEDVARTFVAIFLHGIAREPAAEAAGGSPPPAPPSLPRSSDG